MGQEKGRNREVKLEQEGEEAERGRGGYWKKCVSAVPADVTSGEIRDNPAHLDANIDSILHTQYLINETVNAVGVSECITVDHNGTIW